MMMCKIPCFVCGAELVSLSDSSNHPSGGLEFTTYGHYGTTVFDPMDASELIINICDTCMTVGIDKLRALHFQHGAYADRQVIYQRPRMPPAFEAGES